MSHKQISSKERTELGVLLRTELKRSEIARILGKHRSTISRELKRNSDGEYCVFEAKRKLRERRKIANQRFRKITRSEWLMRFIEKKLKKTFSPEQISGTLEQMFGSKIICTESIYQYIYLEKPGLKKYLRCKKGKYRKRYGTKKKELEREEAKKRRIDTRPEIVERRERIGDWEGDTMRGTDKISAILTYTDRRSGYLMAKKLERAFAEDTRIGTEEAFDRVPIEKRCTVTYDNGGEFGEHELIERNTGLTVYFAYPYHSWERGTNENTNGLLRQFFPKKTSFKDITQKDLDKAVSLINNRPRKRLNYRTPKEVFMECCISN